MIIIKLLIVSNILLWTMFILKEYCPEIAKKEIISIYVLPLIVFVIGLTIGLCWE